MNQIKFPEGSVSGMLVFNAEVMIVKWVARLPKRDSCPHTRIGARLGKT